MKKILLILFLSIFLINFLNIFCFAVPANPDIVEIKQPDGKKIKIRTKGDEFYNWTEDKDGYTVIKDTVTRFWTYAQKDRNGKLRPSKNIVGKINSFSLSIEKNIKDETEFNIAKQNRKIFNERIKNKFNSSTLIKKSSPYSLLSEKELESYSQVQQIDPIPTIKGKKKNFVLLIQFKDLKFVDNSPFTSYTDGKDNDKIRQIFWNLFNEEGYTAYNAVGSVKDYFKEVSYDNLEYNSEISPIITLEFADETKNNYKYYSYSEGANTSFYRTREMIKQALKQLHDSGYNFQNIWPNLTEPEGFTVIHAGGGAETGNRSFIWSHSWTFNTPYPNPYPSLPLTYDGIKFTNYHVEPAGRGYSGSDGLIRIGTICHESVHFFGIPDLYDTTDKSGGLGQFCIMANGSWNGESGKIPAHPCAWIKYRLGWIEPKTAIEGKNFIEESALKKDAFYIFTPKNFNNKEYFLMENRQSVGFDKGLIGNKRGILIYHIDETKDNNDDYTHYMVDIEEADGTADWTKDHLATNSNKGLDSDYFRSNTVTVFNDSCLNSPNSKSYSGENSGIDIYNISATGSIMYFYLPESENLEIFVDNLDSTGINFINLIMKYNPQKDKNTLKNLSADQKEELKQYFTLTKSGAQQANDMGAIYFDYIDNNLVYGIGKDKTGIVTDAQANLIINLNSILTKSKQDITYVGNISEQNKSPLNNITLYSISYQNKSSVSSISSTNKRFTGTDAIESIKKYVEDLGCLIYTFDKMVYKTGYPIIEITKTTSLNDYPNYSLIKGKNSEHFYNLSNVVIYPNPAKNSVINFINLPNETTDLDIEIYTITGHFIKKFNLDDTSDTITGNKKISWDCKNYSGSPIAPGVYIALIKSNSEKKKIKFAIIR